MDSWKSVLASVSGFSHAKYKCFRSRPASEEWYLQQLQVLGIIPEDRELTEDEDSCCGRTVDLNSVGRPSERDTSPLRGGEATAAASYPSRKADLVDFRMTGPDPSTGQSKKMHDISINITSEVRKLLCPKSLTQEMQDRMLEVTPDVLSCQGKTTMVTAGSEFEVESMWNHLAAAMSDMTDVKSQRIGCQPRDTQWNLPSKNALTKVKSLSNAMDFIDALASNRDSVLDAAKGNYLEVLFAAGWNLDDAKIYCEQGGLTILLTRTYDYFYPMIQQIIGKAYLNPD
jgi:hypothetical protein